MRPDSHIVFLSKKLGLLGSKTVFFTFTKISHLGPCRKLLYWKWLGLHGKGSWGPVWPCPATCELKGSVFGHTWNPPCLGTSAAEQFSRHLTRKWSENLPHLLSSPFFTSSLSLILHLFWISTSPGRKRNVLNKVTFFTKKHTCFTTRKILVIISLFSFFFPQENRTMVIKMKHWEAQSTLWAPFA